MDNTRDQQTVSAVALAGLEVALGFASALADDEDALSACERRLLARAVLHHMRQACVEIGILPAPVGHLAPGSVVRGAGMVHVPRG